jgi:ketosteroid isomerase-like protein
LSTVDDLVLAVEEKFFTALVGADVAGLTAALADDFMLVDVMSGGLVPRDALLAMVGSGDLRFEEIEPVAAETSVRHYPGTAVVVGRTAMRGSYQGQTFTARSRYTHLYVADGAGWRLASAQGTQVV